MARFQLEQVEREQQKKRDLEQQSRDDEQILLDSSPLEDTGTGQSAEEEESDEADNDSDWEDLEKEEISTYNTMPLKHFAKVCDRYVLSDRAGAMLANGLLRDLGIVKKGQTAKLVCPSKLRRQREKWGKVLVKEKKKDNLLQGLYTDGKRVPTLVRETTVTKVQVPGGRGRADYSTVSTTSNKTVVQDHYPVLAEPLVSIRHMSHPRLVQVLPWHRSWLL